MPYPSDSLSTLAACASAECGERMVVMRYHLDESCTYRPGDETCFRTDCQINCMRNFRDQMDTDVPLVSQHKQNGHQRVGFWQSLFTRRATQTTH
jgi:hypothetical protein